MASWPAAQLATIRHRARAASANNASHTGTLTTRVKQRSAPLQASCHPWWAGSGRGRQQIGTRVARTAFWRRPQILEYSKNIVRNAHQFISYLRSGYKAFVARGLAIPPYPERRHRHSPVPHARTGPWPVRRRDPHVRAMAGIRLMPTAGTS